MYRILAALGLAALPAALILLYVYRLDKRRPEPAGLVGRSVLYGFLAVIPAVGLELGLSALLPPFQGLPRAFVDAFVVAALVEEGVKLFFLRRYIFKRPEFDERMDGIVYAVAISLGFAFVENFIYGYGDFRILLLRAFTSVPLHAIAAGIMGYYVGLAKVLEASGAPRRGLELRGLGLAILVHGLYDFAILGGGLGALMVFPVLAVGARVLKRLADRARAEDDPAYQRPDHPIL